MKIKRFVARDMRTALAQIKEELGVDAVIMSNKKIPEGVELMAAVDYNQSVPAAQPSVSDSLALNTDDGREITNDVVSLDHQSTAPTSPATEQTASSASNSARPEAFSLFFSRGGASVRGASNAHRPTPSCANLAMHCMHVRAARGAVAYGNGIGKFCSCFLTSSCSGQPAP